ncbi:LOW QUALITY PROTEIN: hypothetical protein V1477_016413 [Vespula maculifrons]|uniref:Uncharacterized protein n=1 Tax=Vespula maculifrons TaxID=7453 RepID=A0ABD2BCY3_VESMC
MYGLRKEVEKFRPENIKTRAEKKEREEKRGVPSGSWNVEILRVTEVEAKDHFSNDMRKPERMR